MLAPMLVGITLLTFLLSHAVPADPVTASLGEQAAADPAVVAAFRHEWGLDRSLPEQYGIYLWNLVRGNFGVSISTRQPVWLDLRQTFPATVELAVVAMTASILVGIPLGVLSAVKRGRLIDHLTRVVSLVGVSVPIFWLGLIALVVFYARLGWAPSPGRLSATLGPPPMVTGFLHPGPVTDFRSAADSDTDRYARFHAHMLDRGVYLAPSQFEAMMPSLAHTPDQVEATIAAAREFTG